MQYPQDHHGGTSLVIEHEVIPETRDGPGPDAGQFAEVALRAEIGIYIEETGINWSEIITYSQEIAADIQEMAANIGEIGIYTRRTAARSQGMAANCPFPLI
jgi:hypothetical protein